jgi:hypothetical protein
MSYDYFRFNDYLDERLLYGLQSLKKDVRLYILFTCSNI